MYKIAIYLTDCFGAYVVQAAEDLAPQNILALSTKDKFCAEMCALKKSKI